jgi:hypothetical protein
VKRIILEAVQRAEMRPPYDRQEEAGDWFIDEGGNLVIRVIGDDIDRPSCFLFALHELVEAALCARRGISQEAVDRFDAEFSGDGEPGDDPACPCRLEHRFAMLIEHLMAHEMGIEGYGRVE